MIVSSTSQWLFGLNNLLILESRYVCCHTSVSSSQRATFTKVGTFWETTCDCKVCNLLFQRKWLQLLHDCLCCSHQCKCDYYQCVMPGSLPFFSLIRLAPAALNNVKLVHNYCIFRTICHTFLFFLVVWLVLQLNSKATKIYAMSSMSTRGDARHNWTLQMNAMGN